MILRQPERAEEGVLQRRFAFGLALNVADGAPQIGLELSQLPPGPLVLLGDSPSVSEQ